MNDEGPRGWHLKKEIQVGHLISTIALGISALVYVGDIKKDVEILKVQRNEQRDRDNKQDEDALIAKRELQQQLQRIDSKLDRLIEARTK